MEYKQMEIWEASLGSRIDAMLKRNDRKARRTVPTIATNAAPTMQRLQ